MIIWGGSWVAVGGCGAAEGRGPVGRIAGVPNSGAGVRWGATISCPLLGIPSPPRLPKLPVSVRNCACPPHRTWPPLSRVSDVRNTSCIFFSFHINRHESL